MSPKEKQTDITSHMRKLVKQEHGRDESDVPYGIPCTPEEWGQLDPDTKKALVTFIEAMDIYDSDRIVAGNIHVAELEIVDPEAANNIRFAKLEADDKARFAERDATSDACDRSEPSLKSPLQGLIKIRHSPSIHENRYISHCGLPESKTREEYIFAAHGLLKAISPSLANDRYTHLLASLIAYAQEHREGIESPESYTLLDAAMELVSKSCDLVDKHKDCLTALFGELETAKYLGSGRFHSSHLDYKGRWVISWRRRDGAPGLDETQSDALSLYHEYLRLRKMQPGYCEIATIKRYMRVYLPLLNRGVRKHYYTKQEQEMGMIEESAKDHYELIKAYIKDGAQVDLLEGLQIDALMKCIQDERIGTGRKAQQLARLKAMANDIRDRRDKALQELDPLMEVFVDPSLNEDSPGTSGDGPQHDKGAVRDVAKSGGDC